MDETMFDIIHNYNRKKRSLGRPAFQSPNNNLAATSTTEVKQTPKETTVTKTVVEPQVKPFESKAYESTVTPFGEIRQPTGLEKMFGIDPSKITNLNKQRALGQDENGEFEAKDFYSAHPEFNVADYLKKAMEAKNKGYYGSNEEGLLDSLSKFIYAPQDEAESTEKAYATNAFDKKIQNLIDDIVLYDAFHNQLLEANYNSTIPKVRADVGRGVREKDLSKRTFNSLMFNDKIDAFNTYKPQLIKRGPDSTYQHVKEKLKDEIAKRRPAIEKDIYRKLADVSQKGSL